jgi:uncharacterized protein
MVSRRNPSIREHNASPASLPFCSTSPIAIDRAKGDPVTAVTSFQLLFPISILAGFIGAMSGMGGGVVIIPVLTLMGVDIKHAIAISIISVIATSSGSASAYIRDHITNLKVGMFLEMFTIVGALAGAKITLAISPKPLYIVFGLVLLSSWLGVLLAKHSVAYTGPQDAFTRWLELRGSYPDKATGQTVHYKARRAYFGAPLMFGAGLIAG